MVSRLYREGEEMRQLFEWHRVDCSYTDGAFSIDLPNPQTILRSFIVPKFCLVIREVFFWIPSRDLRWPLFRGQLSYPHGQGWSYDFLHREQDNDPSVWDDVMRLAFSLDCQAPSKLDVWHLLGTGKEKMKK